MEASDRKTNLNTSFECPLIGNGDSVIIKMRGMDRMPDQFGKRACKQGGTASNYRPLPYIISIWQGIFSFNE